MQQFRYVKDKMEFGDICEGWTPASWAKELRHKAECCRALRPDLAAHYDKWAAHIEKRLSPLSP